ncbi:type II toxin-antitoxin system VapC family toxin [Bacillus sp. USDA818B3_A]|uniref:type II toxin-antitoxin system VapC family toxin n=1 Tax=Bacillus sp. USDA818B3_A TaxID=2698834 RepID=UPI00136B8DE8|nr:PIN domain-containing protein [Bacillus sp. USDA818B3_A]
MSKYVMFDNNMYIYQYQGYDEAQSAITDYIKNGYIPIMSSIVAMEFLSNASLERNPIQKMHREMYLATVAEIVPVDKVIALKAAELRRKYQLNDEEIEAPDALIAATAIVKGAILVSNNDQDFEFAKTLGLQYHNPITSQSRLNTYLKSLRK